MFEQAASVELTNFDPYAGKAISEAVFKPLLGLTPDEAVFEELIKQLDGKLHGYEAILSKRKYLGGDDITLADLFHLPYGSMLKTAGSEIMSDKSRPNVARWWRDITNRPSWLAAKDGLIAPNT